MAMVDFRYGAESDILALKDNANVKLGTWYLATDTGALYGGNGTTALVRIHDDKDSLNDIVDARLAQKVKDKATTSSAKRQVVVADDGTVMSQVVVNPMPYSETTNDAGGTTVTIG